MANREKNEHLRHTSYRLEKEQRERKIGRVIFEMKRSKERILRKNLFFLCVFQGHTNGYKTV